MAERATRDAASPPSLGAATAATAAACASQGEESGRIFVSEEAWAELAAAQSPGKQPIR
jgi:hypothetical protein